MDSSSPGLSSHSGVVSVPWLHFRELWVCFICYLCLIYTSVFYPIYSPKWVPVPTSSVYRIESKFISKFISVSAPSLYHVHICTYI